MFNGRAYEPFGFNSKNFQKHTIMNKAKKDNNRTEAQMAYDALLATVKCGGLSIDELKGLRNAMVEKETENYHSTRKLIYEIALTDDMSHCFKKRGDAIEYLTTDLEDNAEDYFNESVVRLRARWLDIETYNDYNDHWLEV